MVFMIVVKYVVECSHVFNEVNVASVIPIKHKIYYTDHIISPSVLDGIIFTQGVYICTQGGHMATNFRRTKLERYVKRLEVKLGCYHEHSFKAEILREVIAEIKSEFNLKDGDKE